MKKAILSIAMLAAFSGVAVAAPINVGGVAVPTIPAASLTPFSPANGAFTQVLYFNVAANAGSLVANLNWTPAGPSGVTGAFYASNSSGDLLGSSLGSFVADGSRNLEFSYGSITAGYYAFSFTGTSANAATFSGQVSARVPAPAVLGLAGIGLLGLGFFSRRRAV